MEMAYLFIGIAILIVIIVFFTMFPIGLWIEALASGVHVSLFSMFGMRLRRINPAKIVRALIKAQKAGLKIDRNMLEAHFLAGGNVDRVINAMISAQSAEIPLEFEKSLAIDLAGRDVEEAVKMSVNPKVIETPVVAAIAKDGIELRAKARVTVRANIARLVGGAGEETIIARVGEGIVTTVGSSETHKAVLENPDLISRTVLNKGLDAGTAFEILSIDIADVDVGATSARSCRWIRPRPTAASPRPRRRSAARWPWRRSRRCSPACRRCAQGSSPPRPRCPRPWPRRCETASWA